MLLDFCFKKEYYAKIYKVKQKTITKSTKNINNFKFVLVTFAQTQNVNF